MQCPTQASKQYQPANIFRGENKEKNRKERTKITRRRQKELKKKKERKLTAPSIRLNGYARRKRKRNYVFIGTGICFSSIF